MNIRLGIYEIFSRIVPGACYLAAILQFAVITGLISIDWPMLSQIGIVPSVGLIIIAYILGTALDPVSLLWYFLFKPKGMSGRALNELKTKHRDNWAIDFEDRHWPILLAHIRIKNPDIAGDIDRFSAFAIMFRNISLGLILIAINFVVQFFLSKTTFYVFIAGVLFIGSILVIREGIRFREWYYSSIFETTIAYRLSLDEHIKSVKSDKKTKSSR
jgi:hypothetical protein